MLTDIAISGYRNVIKKEAEKILKYKNHIIEIERMWNIKTNVTLGITGVTETISKSSRKVSSNIPGKHGMKELKKTVMLGAAHILRKALAQKDKTFYHGK